jgi:hypothetical protein
VRRVAARVIADAPHAYPCRVSLADAAVGEELVLVHHAHHDVASPHRASGPIYVRRGAVAASLEAGEIPDQARRRLLSLRAYDARGWLVDADVAPGTELEPLIARLFANRDVAYLHAHNARPGCFAFTVLRS